MRDEFAEKFQNPITYGIWKKNYYKFQWNSFNSKYITVEWIISINLKKRFNIISKLKAQKLKK